MSGIIMKYERRKPEKKNSLWKLEGKSHPYIRSRMVGQKTSFWFNITAVITTPVPSRYDHKKPEFELEESKMESNGSFRELIEQRFAAMVGYRKKDMGCRGKSWSQRKRCGQSRNQGNELRFKIDKKKRFKLTLEVFKDIFQICPRVPGRDFDALPSEEDTISFLRDLGHTGVINSLNDVVIDQMHQPWRTFAAEKSLSWRKRIRMHTSKDDYLINTLRFVSRRESSQIYRAVLPECLTSPEMKESKAYKTYLSYATGEVPPKVTRKFKKASPSKKRSIVIREPPVETKSKRKEKENVDVAHGKGIELLSEVVLSKKAQMKEARMKSLREFHKTHLGGSRTVAEKPPSVEKITPTVISKGTGDKPGVPDVTNDDSSESESESWGNDEDDSNNEQESSDEAKNKSKDDEMKSDEEQGINDTIDQFDDDVDARLEEPTETAIGIVQGEGNDAEMTEAQQGNENLETTQEQVVEDAHVTISTIPKKTEVPVTSSSRSSDLASKFLNFSDIPQTDAEIVSPLDVHVYHKVPRTQAPTLLTIPVLVTP
ncbi:hypothetical protein Tco_1419622 [Tanacetum coccineum]